MKKITILSTALCAVMLAGCSVGEDASAKSAKVTGAVDAGLSRLGDRKAIRAGGSQFSDSIYIGATAERSNAATLPARLQSSGAVRLESRDPLTLDEIAQRLSEITGIPHVLALGPTGQLRAANNAVRTASELDSADTPTAPGAGAVPPPMTPPAAGPAAEQLTMRPNLKGSLSDVLDQVTSAFDVEWSYADGRVLLRDYVTRKYQISALPGTSGGTTAIGANDITAQSTLNSDVWGEISDALDSMVGEGASVSIGSSTGIVTVTAKVSDQNRVGEYIKQMNGVIGQQVSFDVNVFTVALNDENNVGIDLGAVLSGRNGSIDYTSAVGGNGAVGAVNIGVIRGDVGVDLVARALATQGKVTVNTRTGTTTSNNRVAPINVIDKTAYLAEVSITDDGDGQERVERTADEIETGFQMQLFPRVLNHREIMVQFTVRLSELNNLATFGEGNEAIQLPEVSTTSFEQQAVLENGQTLVLAGFERERVEVETTASKKGLFGIGGQKAAKVDRVATVMMITPRIISRK